MSKLNPRRLTALAALAALGILLAATLIASAAETGEACQPWLRATSFPKGNAPRSVSM